MDEADDWGISLQHWLTSPVVWSLIILILSSLGILRELL
jgi:membrane-bound ClpP family serine protease